MLIVGLTGGIASGKSTVARLFAQLGVPVLDADAIARELVAPGRPALDRIVQDFGGGVLDPDGGLDRPRLRNLIFAHPDRRRRLEGILHPLIRKEMEARMRNLNAPYCVLVIPLLVETGQEDLVHRVLVVDVPEQEQIRRCEARDGLSRAEITAILAAQATRAQRLASADDVIVNDGTPADLKARVSELHRTYLTLAEQPPG